MNTSLHELYTTVYWALLKESVPGFVRELNENISSHTQFHHEGMPGRFLTRSHSFDPQEAAYVTTSPERDTDDPWYSYISDDDQFIDLVPVNGGITRNPACGYGSRSQRDQVLYASRKSNCIGHIFLIDTPGGSAYSIEDYTEAISAARQAGQPVIACIDGLCASAGYALACQCDSIYYTSPSNIVGCIGCMAIFSTSKDGDQNTITQETYHEVYDPESYDKNLEFRNSADGDDSLILQQLSVFGQSFRDLVTRCRPQVTEDQLHGRTYHASEVEGTLVDSQLSLQGCIDLLTRHSDNQNSCTAIHGDAPTPPNDMIDNNLQTALIEAQSSITALQEKLTSLEAKLTEKDSLLAEQSSSLETSNHLLEETRATLEDTAKDLEESTTALACAQSSLTEKDSEIAALKATLAEKESALTTCTEALSKAQADIEELSRQPAPAPTPAPATAAKGDSDEGPQRPTTACVATRDLTIAQRRLALQKRNRQLGIH